MNVLSAAGHNITRCQVSDLGFSFQLKKVSVAGVLDLIGRYQATERQLQEAPSDHNPDVFNYYLWRKPEQSKKPSPALQAG